jgi:hypothetical protein
MFVVTEKAKTKLLEVKQQIIEEPRKFDMLNYGGDASYYAPFRRPPCNTVACIAGWIVLNERPNTPLHYITTELAVKILGYDLEFFVVRNFTRLFISENWPYEFNKRYMCGPYTIDEVKANAQLAGEVIDYFIEHNGFGRP